MLQVERLSKRYGDRLALDAVSFSMAAGETVGLLGPNGAGNEARRHTVFRFGRYFQPTSLDV